MPYNQFLQQDQVFDSTEPTPGGFIEDTPAKGPIPDESGPFTGPPGPDTPGGKPVGWQGEKPAYLPNQPEFMPTAAPWEVTEDQLVEERMEGIMAKNSDLSQLVSERARRAHAARGGQNSLMASLGAEVAVADMAFEIASKDAATFARSAEFNAAMENQFGLSEQKFMHNAMLSEQNFRQARLLQAQQIAASRAAAAAATSRALTLADREQEHWLERNGILHEQALEVMDIKHGYNQEMSFQNYEQQWLLGEQGQAHSLERMDRQTDNAIRAAEQDFGWQMTLNYQSEIFAVERERMRNITLIGTTEGLTMNQQSAAISQINDVASNTYDLTSAFYTSSGGPRWQASWYDSPGGEPYVPPGEEGGPKGKGSPWRNPYEGRYGDYLSYGHGGYSLYMPPVPTSMGGVAGQGMQMVGGSMYGSNPAYAQQGWEYTQPWFRPPQAEPEPGSDWVPPPGWPPGSPPPGGPGGPPGGSPPNNAYIPPDQPGPRYPKAFGG